VRVDVVDVQARAIGEGNLRRGAKTLSLCNRRKRKKTCLAPERPGPNVAGSGRAGVILK